MSNTFTAIKRYNEFKDSSIEWIGKIPEHWNVNRGKNVLTLLKREVENNMEVITCFRDGQVTLRSNRREDGFTFADKECGYQGIFVGDLVIHGMDGFAGAIGISDSRGKGSPVLNVCNPKNNYSVKYIYYYLRMLASQNIFVAMATGIRERSCDLRWQKIANLLFILPTVYEQKEIADYLDKKCGEIDRVVETQKDIIKKLKEYKQSVITEAVTKGLDKFAPLKDSDIEWIGKIPQHWDVRKLKTIGIYRNGLTYSPEDLCEDNEGMLVLRSSNIKNGKLILNDNVYVRSNIPKSLIVQKGDILICSRNGSKELIGKNAIINEDITASFGAFMMIFRCNYSKYMYYILNSHIFSYYLGSFFTSTINQLTGKNFGDMDIVFCSEKKEQDLIAEYLDKKCSEIDSVISDKKRLIEKLTEYKKSLIYECATGKRKVIA